MLGYEKAVSQTYPYIVSAKQARLFGAEYGRGKRGEKKETGMSQAELRRHLLEWSKKKKKKKR